MNETERDRILRMVSDGTLRPAEAAHLLAALADEPSEVEGKTEEKKKAGEKEAAKKNLIEVQMQRPDGSSYTVQVPPNLFPMVWQITKVAIKESARTAAKESWDGLKHIVRAKTDQVKSNVKARVSGSKAEETASPALAAQEQQAEARRRILQMVQNGRITAADASRLIQQMDALEEYQKTHPAESNLPAKKA